MTTTESDNCFVWFIHFIFHLVAYLARINYITDTHIFKAANSTRVRCADELGISHVTVWVATDPVLKIIPHVTHLLENK